jgi:hypothetical protein
MNGAMSALVVHSVGPMQRYHCAVSEVSKCSSDMLLALQSLFSTFGNYDNWP